MSERLLIVGDALLDRDVEGRSERLCPDAPVPVVDQETSRARPGGAGLAALLAARAGITTTLLTALAPDDSGGELARALLAAGVELIDLGLEGTTPEKVRVLDRGRPVMRLDRGGGRPRTDASAAATLAGTLQETDGILVSDYGNGVAALPWVRAALSARPTLTPLVWDPHPRGPSPIPGATLVTPNRAEAEARAGASRAPSGTEGRGGQPSVRGRGERDGADGLGGQPSGRNRDRGGAEGLGGQPSVKSRGERDGATDRGARPAAGSRGPRGGADAPDSSDAPVLIAAALRAFWEAEAVVVTCGADGAALSMARKPDRPSPVGDRPGTALSAVPESLVLPAEPSDGDPCGAGDRFAVEAAWILACGGDASVAAWLATVAASAFVADGGARAIEPSAPDQRRAEEAAGLGAAPLSIEPALRLAAATRRAGGTVVATGGCFDLLHAGHLGTLRAARALGDCLVVLLNGDRSVRRLKGPERPLVDELERAELLAALDCVDEVVIFDEDTPVDALALLRPDIWAKGGDYAPTALPEREALAGWGGRVVLLPFLAGKSTTRLIEKVGQHG